MVQIRPGFVLVLLQNMVQIILKYNVGIVRVSVTG